MSDDFKQAVEGVTKAFDEFKATNDQNLKQRDVLLDEKLNKINAKLDGYEALNQKLTLQEQRAKAAQEQMDRIEAAMNRASLGNGKPEDREAAEYLAAFNRILRRPAEDRDPKDVAVLAKRKAALVKGDDAGAGYLLAPPDVQRDIIKDVIEMNPIRSIATVRVIGGPSLKQPKRTAAAGAATRVGETTGRANTGDPAYGLFEIQAPELFARAEISQQMLEDSDYDLIAELRSEFSEQFAVKEGVEFIAGSGAANQAEGLLTAQGVGEIVSGNATEITADGLISLFYGLKSNYARSGMFLLNRGTIAAIRKLKTGDGQYLWMPGLASGVPNTILGAPYVEAPDMPNIGAGSFPVAFGDFRRAYVIVDRIGLSFQPDYTTGADDGVVVFRARKRVGGGVRQTEAFKKLKIAAA